MATKDKPKLYRPERFLITLVAIAAGVVAFLVSASMAAIGILPDFTDWFRGLTGWWGVLLKFTAALGPVVAGLYALLALLGSTSRVSRMEPIRPVQVAVLFAACIFTGALLGWQMT